MTTDARITPIRARDLRFVCTLPQGIHARPASLLAETARRFISAMTISHAVTKATADVRSVLSVIGLDIKHTDAWMLHIQGPDADDAAAAFERLVDEHFYESPVDPAAHDVEPALPQIPTSLKRMQVHAVMGRGIGRGVGEGTLVFVPSCAPPHEALFAPTGLYDVERARVTSAFDNVRARIEDRFRSTGGLRRDLMRAHLGILGDPALRETIEHELASGSNAVGAVTHAIETFAGRLREAASVYIQDRALDVEDIGGQLVDLICGNVAPSGALDLIGPTILIADRLTPTQLMSLDRSLVAGLVLGRVGATSHTVILARAMGIPTVIDLETPVPPELASEPAIVDADANLLILQPSPAAQRWYAIASSSSRQRARTIAPLLERPAHTRDGKRLEIGVNSSDAVEITASTTAGAEGVGLLRTEMLFLDRTSPPSEDEQFQTYSAAVRAAGGRTVIIRTLDIGGDKPVPYFAFDHEDNPFLGCRGIRISRRFPDLFRAQLRAICRASTRGPVKVMAPMITDVEEARWFRSEVERAQSDLRGRGEAFDHHMPVGMMIEVPAVTTIIDALSSLMDFFSIGTNDLAQYWTAVDRGNPRVASLADPRQPSFLRVLRSIVDDAHRCNRWVGLCGEMAGDPLNLALMVGLGLDEISVAAPIVPRLKAAVARLDSARCKSVLDECAASADTSQAIAILQQPPPADTKAAIIDPTCVIVDSDADSKEEAIATLVGALYAANRTDDPRQLEEAVWSREVTYATGLGHAFAIPHCKCDAITGASIAALRLRSPIEWGSIDNLPVRFVILLAIRASGADQSHMKILAAIARKLMHDEFRDSLMTAPNALAIAGILAAETGSTPR